jgi:hypothetical protein
VQAAAIYHKESTLSSLISASILFATVSLSVTFGILGAYATVIAILRSLAPQIRPVPQPALVQNQAQAAHASGD